MNTIIKIKIKTVCLTEYYVFDDYVFYDSWSDLFSYIKIGNQQTPYDVSPDWNTLEINGLD